MKTLGEVAHEAGAKHGGWSRKWTDMPASQQQEWEAIAQAVIDENERRLDEKNNG